MALTAPLFVVVTGPPGSGKTTLATALAAEMRIPLFAKDAIKEVLMTVLLVPDVETSKKMGRAAIEIMYALASTASSGAVLESNFHRTISRSELQELPGPVVEVFCRCDREVALARYRERSASRHPGHFDVLRTDDELWHNQVTSPVGGGWPVVEADTNNPIDVSALVLRLGQLSESA